MKLHATWRLPNLAGQRALRCSRLPARRVRWRRHVAAAAKAATEGGDRDNALPQYAAVVTVSVSMARQAIQQRDERVAALVEAFPSLSVSHVTAALRMSDGNEEVAVAELLQVMHCADAVTAAAAACCSCTPHLCCPHAAGGRAAALWSQTPPATKAQCFVGHARSHGPGATAKARCGARLRGAAAWGSGSGSDGYSRLPSGGPPARACYQAGPTALELAAAAGSACSSACNGAVTCCSCAPPVGGPWLGGPRAGRGSAGGGGAGRRASSRHPHRHGGAGSPGAAAQRRGRSGRTDGAARGGTAARWQ